MPLRPFAAAIGLLLTLNTVQAAEPRFELDLEAQDLKSTLRNIATQTSVELRYADELLLGKTAPGLHGRYTLRQALEQLLNGTELSYNVNPPGVVTIQRRAGSYTGSQRPSRVRSSVNCSATLKLTIYLTASRRLANRSRQPC